MKEFKYFQLIENEKVTVATLAVCRMQDNEVAEAMSSELQQYVTEYQPSELVVDFSSVEVFRDILAAGIIRSKKQMQSDGGYLILAGMRQDVSQMFRIFKLDRILHIVDSVEVAIQTFVQRRIFQELSSLRDDTVIKVLVAFEIGDIKKLLNYVEMDRNDVPIVSDRLFDLGGLTSENLRALFSQRLEGESQLRIYETGSLSPDESLVRLRTTNKQE